MNTYIKDHIRKIWKQAKEYPVKGCEAQFLVFEYFGMLHRLDIMGIEYNTMRMYKLLTILRNRLLKEIA